MKGNLNLLPSNNDIILNNKIISMGLLSIENDNKIEPDNRHYYKFIYFNFF